MPRLRFHVSNWRFNFFLNFYLLYSLSLFKSLGTCQRTFETMDAQHQKQFKPEEILGYQDDKKATTRLLLSRQEFSKLIGKGGDTIKQIRTTCGANVKGFDIDSEERVVSASDRKDYLIYCMTKRLFTKIPPGDYNWVTSSSFWSLWNGFRGELILGKKICIFVCSIRLFFRCCSWYIKRMFKVLRPSTLQFKCS